jgi:hypothetical protein
LQKQINAVFAVYLGINERHTIPKSTSIYPFVFKITNELHLMPFLKVEVGVKMNYVWVEFS